MHIYIYIYIYIYVYVYIYIIYFFSFYLSLLSFFFICLVYSRVGRRDMAVAQVSSLLRKA